MKLSKLLSRISLLVVLLICIASAFGVAGSWIYYKPTDAYDYGFTAGMVDFGYTPEEILPGGGGQAPGEDSSGGSTEVTPGENHYVLIDLVLNENDKGYGLNINNNVVLHQYLRREGAVYCNQKVSGGNLKFILDPTNNTHGLYYALLRISDTEYHCFTFSEEELISAEETGSEINVYKTLLIKTDEWRATKSYLGHAPVISMRSIGVSADSQSEPYTIDMAKWHPKH